MIPQVKVKGSTESDLRTVINSAWKSIGPRFVLGKSYPVTVTLNGRTVKFGMFKRTGAGPIFLETLVSSKRGISKVFYKMRGSGGLVTQGSRNLWALNPSVRDEEIQAFEILFRN